MLVISNSMPKSGSTLLRWYTLELLAAYYPSNGQAAFREAIHQGKLDGVGMFLHRLDRDVCRELLRIARTEGTVVAKVHHELTPELRAVLESEPVKVTFIHRDPRDVMLSARDHYRRTRDSHRPAFPQFSSILAGLPSAAGLAASARVWQESGLACMFRYVDLVTNPRAELGRLCAYLGLPVEPEVIERVVQSELRQRQPGRNQFHRGDPTRFRRELSAAELRACNRRLSRYLRDLGYERGNRWVSTCSALWTSLWERVA